MPGRRIWFPLLHAGSGSEVYTRRVAEGLVRRGLSVHISHYRHGLQYLPRLMRYASAAPRADVAFANSWNAFAFRGLAARLVVLQFHCVFDPALVAHGSRLQRLFHEGLVRGWERRSFEAADSILAISEYTAASYQEAFGVRADSVIHCGVDTGFFLPGEPRSRDPDRPCELLFVGNPSHRKGADLLPRIMQRLGPGYRLACTSGLRRSGIARLGDNIRVLPRLSDEGLRDAYRAADILLFPSRFEGFGLVALEAMACGTPVVATASSALPEVVEDGVTGRLCAVDDVEGFAAAVEEIWKQPALREGMGRRGRERALRVFGFDSMIDRYCELIDRL